MSTLQRRYITGVWIGRAGRGEVKRNKERFPENFMIQLSEEEVEVMVSHFAIPSKQALGGTLPYAFTEHGVLMVSNV